MLHHPFVDWADLTSVNGQPFGSYINAFHACKRLHTHPNDFYTDPVAEDSSLEDENSNGVPEDPDIDFPLADFEAFARRRPRYDLADLAPGGLGNRALDQAYDWTSYVGRYNNFHVEV
jgi:hypothetical protein